MGKPKSGIPNSRQNGYIVDLFPKVQMELPKNIAESWHHARDIMHADDRTQYAHIKGNFSPAGLVKKTTLYIGECKS